MHDPIRWVSFYLVGYISRTFARRGVWVGFKVTQLPTLLKEDFRLKQFGASINYTSIIFMINL